MTAAAPADLAAAAPTEAVRRRGVRLAIAMQCGSCLAIAALQNGQVLLYLHALGLSGVATIALLALPSLAYSLLVIPAAYACDSLGLKRVGRVGTLTTAVGFSLLPLAGVLPAASQRPVLVAGFLLYATGTALFSACWFVIVDPLVAPSARGRFWGRLRTAWQATALVFGGLCLWLIGESSPLWALVVLLAAVAVGQWLRAVLFAGFPELVRGSVSPGGFLAALLAAARTPGYLPFGAYVFLLTLFTAACPNLFALIEKQALHYPDATVVGLGIALMVGGVVGSHLGGRAVDRWGMKPVFIVCHFAYGVILLLFLARALAPIETVWLGALTFAFAAVAAAAQVAISSEMLGLLPPENRSLAVSVLETLRSSGVAAAGLLSAGVLKLGMLKDEWSLAGLTLTAYDTLLLGCGTMVMLCVVSLGLVPSVLARAAAGDRPVAP